MPSIEVHALDFCLIELGCVFDLEYGENEVAMTLIVVELGQRSD